MKRLCFIMWMFSSCITSEQESVAYYYIVNTGNDSLKLEYGGGNSGSGIQSDSTMPMTTHCFYTAREGTGGHVLPSNFFTVFKVWKISAGGDSLIYQGVNNSDWKIENYADDRYNLYLHVE